ncbi:hypothetical protein, partial [Salmonella sp. s51944]|uniref:hypothetical protein n=1 Tax=Salmonella sp. s51944 TaxID=3159655 RepID=UPI00397FBF7E
RGQNRKSARRKKKESIGLTRTKTKKINNAEGDKIEREKPNRKGYSNVRKEDNADWKDEDESGGEEA